MARRKWSVEEKMNIVLEGMGLEGSISEICRTHGILQPSDIWPQRSSGKLYL
ncbi:transposase [Aneurinibacillus aneurinilyticus]|uniref:Transposase n=1 Tax=Aneurinibacillus aneurinilyticus TaxID=1391 RepID=A0A848CY86_ANEAE|nr:transposase [Aneurinibacillus aneurinilyticus]